MEGSAREPTFPTPKLFPDEQSDMDLCMKKLYQVGVSAVRDFTDEEKKDLFRGENR